MIVTGLGQCSLDYLLLADTYPGVDSKKEVSEWHEQGGGPVATALVALSRLGVACRFLGITGEDEAGEKIRQSLIYERIDITGLRQRKSGTSQIACIVVEEDTAKRTIFWKRPSGEPLRSDEISSDFLDGSSFLLIDGLMNEPSRFAAERARSLNIPVMLDAGRARPGMAGLARLSDYVVTSEEFARDLRWDLAPHSLEKERKRLGIPVLTVTLGERGSITVSGDAPFEIPAFRVKPVDTTGAGDVFHGGYIYGLLQGWHLRDTVTFASAMAALKCLKMGGRAGIPSLEEVLKFLSERGHPFLQKQQ